MGYLLLDRPNPNGPHFYTTRNKKLLAIVVHITAGIEDLDTMNDISAENTAEYCRTTDREVSWHSGSDADSWVDLLPAGYTAWHASAYNGSTYGHEISKRHTDWRSMTKEWVDKTLSRAAGLKAIAVAHGIPLRKATRAELDREIAKGAKGVPVGFISHAEIQPADRTDPGWVSGVDTFPWTKFFAYMTTATQEDDMQLTDMVPNYPSPGDADQRTEITVSEALGRAVQAGWAAEAAAKTAVAAASAIGVRLEDHIGQTRSIGTSVANVETVVNRVDQRDASGGMSEADRDALAAAIADQVDGLSQQDIINALLNVNGKVTYQQISTGG